MKISFMTWACPDWNVDQILDAAVRYSYDGVEPRVEANQRHGIELEATAADRASIRRRFADAGIEMSCLATSRTYALADAADRSESVARTLRYCELAADLGCPYLRVFGGSTPEGVSPADAQRCVAESLAAAGSAAVSMGVTLCLETHDGYCDADLCAATVTMADAPGLGICWDIMHPFRVGQTIAHAHAAVRDLVRHCHTHDAILGPGGSYEMTLMGEGNLPHDEAVSLLVGDGFEGYMSGEHIDFLSADELLPHEARLMRSYIAAAEVA